MNDSRLRDRVDEVLNRAAASSNSIVADDGSAGEDEAPEMTLLETAQEANELLETADPADLLAAVGLDTLADGTEPASIPEAIARGDQETLEDLQRLLHLAKLAGRADDGTLDATADGLRETIGDREESAKPDADTTADADTEATGGDTADETSDDLGDRLRSSMRSSFEQFGGDVAQLRERLESASDGTARSDASAADETAIDAGSADEGGTEEAAHKAEATDEEADEGVLGSGLGGDRTRGTSGGASRHSTMPPPPSERADMRGVTRHSTMPDKHG
ncbi:hypothetical protein [Natrinema longum]|uniref:Uncharacterized protein n=1 Tax=Natrinema longum TaxID=370324 RepID=A0A8A2U8C1_9EURY|nr:hypothetical protein [Natrinema longum]MBZ6493587.1 hypothetical protein [Natrinema longum]QSW85069.1 hypothetical protein J0X27_16730 [Natrinema longum]